MRKNNTPQNQHGHSKAAAGALCKISIPAVRADAGRVTITHRGLGDPKQVQDKLPSAGQASQFIAWGHLQAALLCTWQ